MKRTIRTLSFPLALAAIVACGDEDTHEHDHGDDTGMTDAGMDDAGASADAGTDVDDTAREVTIRFALRADGVDVGCDDTLALGADGTEITLSDARFYVHGVTLTGPDGDAPLTLAQDETWQLDDIALLDFEDGTGACSNGNALLNDVVVGTVPAGTYTGLSFIVGVPFERNHDDVATAPAPMSYSAMFWNWQGGYKFIRLEGTNAGDGMRLHLGSTMCEGTAGDISGCGRPNRPEVTFDTFDAAGDVVVLDIAALWADSALAANTPDTSPGCMSAPDDPDCNEVFGTLGIDAQGMGTAAQTAFVVAAE